MHVCVKVGTLEGRDEAVEKAVKEIREAGDRVSILATVSVRSGETSDKMLEWGVKMYDSEHSSADDLPAYDKLIDLTSGEAVEGKSTAELEMEALAAQMDRARTHGIEVKGTESYDELEIAIKDAKAAAKKAAAEAKKAEAKKPAEKKASK
jgi:hypothetical protein